MNGRRITLAAAIVAAALAGCSSPVKLNEGAPVADAKPNVVGGAGGAGGAQGAGAAQSSVATVDLSKNAAAAASNLGRVVYFDFDSYVVRDEFRSLIEGHAKALAAAKTKKMVIEGHTDERGGREYNLALGQRRAEAVARSLALLGVGSGQVEAVSFGEERPAVEGHDEAAWAKNRRAELKDK
ncbi:MAG: peptidoglycan-associated lipoprotein Pal [Burkholderiaceae bacterium]